MRDVTADDAYVNCGVVSNEIKCKEILISIGTEKYGQCFLAGE